MGTILWKTKNTPKLIKPTIVGDSRACDISNLKIDEYLS